MPGMDKPWHTRTTLRLLWCVAGGSAGITLALWLAGPAVNPFLLASLGGTAVFLFGLTQAPAAQPRALFGGHLGGACIGIACHQMWGDGLAVYALALGFTLAFMLTTRTVHPPAGANPVLMVYVHASWPALWQPVLVGVLALAAVAAVWSRLYPGLCRYPQAWWAPNPPSVHWGGWGAG
jgi:CBS-domain-containing membrane protein